jgi:hypothetical protein
LAQANTVERAIEEQKPQKGATVDPTEVHG